MKKIVYKKIMVENVKNVYLDITWKKAFVSKNSNIFIKDVDKTIY